jgi:23S rRNA U2552 (ribose-2'-O)-methylase RlmE/FtsJ
MSIYKLKDNDDYIFKINLENKVITKNTLNDKLIETKKKIDDFPELWEKYKKFTNPYEYIFISNNSNKNVCKIRPISRSFFKLHEFIKDHNIFENASNINVACIAEGPGGFIQSILHNLKDTNINIENLYGITLISNSNKVPSWNNTILNNSKITILKGVNKDGDICNINNIKSFINDIGENSCDLVTNDGGIDFSIDYNKQEELSYKFIYYEILISLHIQKIGGTCIIKLFDILHINTQQLLFILKLTYKDVYICKPVTSRSTNSEKYIICKGYIKNDTILSFLKKNCHSINNINIILPDTFIKELNQYNNNFITQQIDNINFIIDLIKLDKNINNPSNEQLNLAKEWCLKYDLPINT